MSPASIENERVFGEVSFLPFHSTPMKIFSDMFSRVVLEDNAFAGQISFDLIFCALVFSGRLQALDERDEHW